MRVRKIELSENWTIYHVLHLDVYLTEDQLDVVAEEEGWLPNTIEETYCEGYLEKELRHAVALKINYGITQ